MPGKPADHPRRRAVEALVLIDEQHVYIDRAIDPKGLDARERRQLTEYVAGVTRQRRWLDFVIGSFYHGNVSDLQPKLRQILRLGLYEMLFLNTPIHAAVNESVELAKSEIRRGAGGLVNGVLRAIDRNRNELPEPSSGSQADNLAIRYSHPTWMVERWLKRYGVEQTKELLKWNNARPVHGVRVNQEKMAAGQFRELLDEQEIPYEPSPYLADFFRLPHLQPLFQTNLVDKGEVVIQDESAGLAVQLLSPQPGDTVLDMCAAPGGKSLYMAALMKDQGSILACDIHKNRLEMVEEAAGRTGITCIRTLEQDARTISSNWQGFPVDRILLDAPCSGMGVLSKRADLRWHRIPNDLEELKELQDELLDAAAEYLRPGGTLVYSTCTIEPEENEQRIEGFLRRHPMFSVDGPPASIPDELQTSGGFVATFPPRDGVDGSFAIRLACEGA